MRENAITTSVPSETNVFDWSIADGLEKRYGEVRNASKEVLHEVKRFANLFRIQFIIGDLWVFITIGLMCLSIKYPRPVWLVLVSFASAILFSSLFYALVINTFFTRNALRFAKYIADNVPHDQSAGCSTTSNVNERLLHLCCGAELIGAFSNSKVSPKLSEGQRLALSEANITVSDKLHSISKRRLAKLFRNS